MAWLPAGRHKSACRARRPERMERPVNRSKSYTAARSRTHIFARRTAARSSRNIRWKAGWRSIAERCGLCVQTWDASSSLGTEVSAGCRASKRSIGIASCSWEVFPDWQRMQRAEEISAAGKRQTAPPVPVGQDAHAFAQRAVMRAEWRGERGSTPTGMPATRPTCRQLTWPAYCSTAAERRTTAGLPAPPWPGPRARTVPPWGSSPGSGTAAVADYNIRVASLRIPLR
jgi:hypothetical protein